MKDLTKYLLVLAIGLVIGFLLFKSCQKPEPQDHTQRIRELTSERDSLGKEIDALLKIIDSLSTIKQTVKTQIVFRERQINENIAKDSSNALVEYRRSLQDNNYLPDGTLYLSYREIGLGAILMAKVPKMQLQINICEEQLDNYRQVVADDIVIKKGYKENLKIKDLEIQEWKGKYDKETSFWNSNGLWFGVGVITTAAIIFLTGVAK
jgi:hypothetical protein